MLTDGQRKLLRNARMLIEIGKEDFVCFAIRQAWVADSGYIEHEEMIELKKWVNNAVFMTHKNGTTTNTLSAWQYKNGWGHRGDEQLRRDRLAWIDWLLEEAPPAPVPISPDPTYYLAA
jgi:hypothetical protein